MSFFRDVNTAFVREMRPTLADPSWMAFGLVQPLLYIAFFVPLLNIGGSTGEALQWFVPGMIVMLTLFGTAMVGWSLTEELLSGVMERFLATPMSRPAMLFGRSLKEMFPLALQALAMIIIAWPFGMQPFPLQMLIGLAVLALFGAGVAALSYSLAIAAKHNTSLFYMVSQSISLPLMLLGGVLLPIENGPGWLYIASRFNPLTSLVEAERALFAGELLTTTVACGVLVALGTAIVGLTVGARMIRKAGL